MYFIHDFGVFVTVWENIKPQLVPPTVSNVTSASSKGQPVVPLATTAQWVLIRPAAQRKLSALPAGYD